MIPVYGVEQGTEEWLRLRAGVITASEFDRIITPKTMRPSSQRETYVARLAAEWLLGEPIIQEPVGWMHHGMAFEPEAIKAWAFLREREPDRPALVYKDDRRLVACSPDAIGLEVKCPSPQVQAYRLLHPGLPDEYVCQVQGQMYVTGAETWDFLSYAPRMPYMLVTVERDDAFIARLHEVVEETIEMLLKARMTLYDMMEGQACIA